MQIKSKPKVSIVVVNYNTSALIKKCLTHIHNQKGVQTEIIVVDNGSEDDSVGTIRKHYASITLIENKKNIGLTRAYNQAVETARGKYLLLLNSDAYLPPQALNELVEFADITPNLGALSPRLVNPDGTAQPLAFHFPSISGAIREYWLGQKGGFSKYLPPVDKPTIVDVVVEACLLIPRQVFDQVGKSNERLFLYFGDLDLCKRIKNHGLSVWYNPSITVTHELGASGKSPLPTPQYLKDSLTWPIRSIFKPRNQSPTQRYFLGDSITYFGWPRHTLITIIIWLAQKLGIHHI